MSDILDDLSTSARNRVKSGYYKIDGHERQTGSSISFSEAIETTGSEPIVGEIKPGSPTRGKLFEKDFDPVELGRAYSAGGAAGFSVLTDPDHFLGSLENLAQVAKLNKPTLMKDFVVDHSQIEAGKESGADAVLLIYRLFSRGVTSFDLGEGIGYAHDLGLEVLVEINDLAEYRSARETDADMIGINNRDLRSLEIDITRTRRILEKAGKDRVVWTMSGISGRSDIRFLRDAGADAFLVGTALSKSDDPGRLIRELKGDSRG